MEKLWDALGKLAESTGVAVEQLYVVLQQQAKVQLVCDILLVVAIVIALISAIIITIKLLKKVLKDGMYSDWEIPAMLSAIVTVVLGIISLFVVPMNIIEIVQILVNPPVWILEYVVNLIK